MPQIRALTMQDDILSARDSSQTVPLPEVANAANRVAEGARFAVLFYGRDGAQTVTLSQGETFIVGRSAPADIVVHDASVSREHARFSIDGEGRLCVEDLGSRNGTFLNGEQVTEVALRGGEELLLGAMLVGVHPMERGRRRLHGLESHDRFCARLEDEVSRALHFRRPLCLMLVRTPGHMDAVVTDLLPELRRVDRAAAYSDEIIEVLLPEVDVEKASQIARQLQNTVKTPLTIGIASAPGGGRSGDELLGFARDAVSAASPGGVVVGDPSSTRSVGTRGADLHGPIIASAAMRELFETIDRAAKTPIPVLILGETGSGKEVIAQQLHKRSSRRAGEMVCVNCGAIPEQLIESTLFGHEKGAFTGADSRMIGVFEAASGGSILLDEIGELPAQAQAALLRVLEIGKITRVGSAKEIDVDARIIAATHRDLPQMVAAGEFREDLLYRLDVLTLRVPPLRDRPEEIPLLVERFMQAAVQRMGVVLDGIDDDALDLLETYRWPGNVRELKNTIDRAAVVARDRRITVADLPERVRVEHTGRDVEPNRPVEVKPIDGNGGDFRSRMKTYERGLLIDALGKTDGVQTEAAKLLDMPVRTFVHKLRSLGIKRKADGYHVVDDD